MYSIKEDYHDSLAIAIIPVKDLNISEKYKISDVTIYPKKSIDEQEIIGNKLDFDFLELQQEFYNSSLIVMPINHYRKNIIGTLTPNEKNKILDTCFEKADDTLNIMKYVYSNFDKVSNSAQKAGYINNIYSGLLIYYPSVGNSDFVKEKYKINNQVIGTGLSIDLTYEKTALDKHFSIIKDDCNEVGNILKHALRLYANIVESNNLTNKFMQAMSLIEYLANPFEYEKMQVAKSKILPFSSDSKKNYHFLCERFKWLTSQKDSNGNQIGLRTNIIHNGKTLEEMLEKEYEGTLLIRELQEYICNYIEVAFDHYDKDWNYFIKVREERFNKIINIKSGYEGKVTADVMVLIDFEFFNKALKEIYLLYPQHENKKFNLAKFLSYLMIQVDIERKDYQIPVQIIINDKNLIFNCDDNRTIDKFENLGFDSDSGEFDIYVTEVKTNYYDELEYFFEQYSKEKNHILTPSSKFNNIIFISDRNGINHQLFSFIEQSVKKIYLGRLDNKRTDSFSDSNWFDIQYLFLDCLGIPITEESKNNFIFDVL